MAFDSARARVVLFGGEGYGVGGTSQFNDTWEWDGDIWTQVSDMGPSPRQFHAMAYDTKRQRLVLFGGMVGTGLTASRLGDTWEWNGEYWTQMADTGPSARLSSAMAYDIGIHRVVLQGGFGDDVGETWEWDGENWTQTESDIGPGFRFGHAMAYDGDCKRLVLFGGEPKPSESPPKDTWERKGAIWSRVADTGPEPRWYHAMAYDTKYKQVILFGGGAATRNSETWQWDGKYWAQRGHLGPEPRAYHAMAYDSVRERVVLFGGHNGSYYIGDTWELADYPASETS
jgi:hypothetical protein